MAIIVDSIFYKGDTIELLFQLYKNKRNNIRKMELKNK